MTPPTLVYQCWLRNRKQILKLLPQLPWITFHFWYSIIVIEKWAEYINYCQNDQDHLFKNLFLFFYPTQNLLWQKKNYTNGSYTHLEWIHLFCYSNVDHKIEKQYICDLYASHKRISSLFSVVLLLTKKENILATPTTAVDTFLIIFSWFFTWFNIYHYQKCDQTNCQQSVYKWPKSF